MKIGMKITVSTANAGMKMIACTAEFRNCAWTFRFHPFSTSSWPAEDGGIPAGNSAEPTNSQSTPWRWSWR